MIKVVFLGSSKYSTIVQKALFKKFGLSLTVTIPDKPVGRKKILTPSPVKQFATSVIARRNDEAICIPGKIAAGFSNPRNDVPVITADKLDNEIIKQIAEYNPDFLVVADYGLILPKELLKLPKFAPLNVHHSLLPKYRGPSPAPTAILNGDKTTGVTIIKMSEKMDTGSILAQKKYELKKDETTDSLLTKLNELGGKLVIDVIENYEKIKPISQDESKTSYTQKITKEDGYFDMDNPPSPEILDRMIRAYFPWPNAWGELRIRNKELRIKLLPDKTIQVEGGKPMSMKDFINGYPEAGKIINKLLIPNL
ncbi:MAG: methionyl-tRNA formyltransferase [Candidatus Levybacteria bacterium]|nr:methionyl-tRNA formyltransferase [Candidatus Levybacteria bacterium]